MTTDRKTGTVVLSGIGGYGGTYLQLLRPLQASGRVRLTGVIDPAASRAPDYAALLAAGVPVWPDFGAFRAAGVRPDLVILASPIQFHGEQSCAALDAGLSVLCEKPAAATVAETERMRRSREAGGRLLAIGYQWSFSQAIQTLKEDILAGRYGAPRRFRAWVAWPRTSAYYGRNGWAGRIRDGAGRPVFDSPVNNATAHYLHNLLYLLGERVDRAAAPARVAAELYRANAIENFDAACLRIQTAGGVEVLFYTAHCVKEQQQPEFVLEFEHGRVAQTFGEPVIGTSRDGVIRDYGRPDDDLPRKLLQSLDAAAAGRTDTPCGIEAASMHTRVVDALQGLTVHDLAADVAVREEVRPGEILTFVPDITAAMRACFESGRLFSEAGVAWARPAETASIVLPASAPPARCF